MEVSGKLNERLGAHQGVFQEYSARGASRATTLFYCACSSVKREPRCYIRAPPSVAIFQQVVGNVYAFLCIRITRLISFGVCAGFFRFAVHGGEVILLLNHENYNHYGFHDGYDG